MRGGGKLYDLIRASSHIHADGAGCGNGAAEQTYRVIAEEKRRREGAERFSPDVFRAADRVSQYMIRNVAYADEASSEMQPAA